MAKKDSAPHNMSVLEQQKQQLVNAFTDLAATMRRAAQEAETMAKLMADPSIPNETKAAFQQRNSDFARILTSGGASTSSSSSLPLPPASSFPLSHGIATTSSNGAMTSPSSEGSPTLGPAHSAMAATPAHSAAAAPSKKRSRASEGPGLAVDDDGKKKRKKREPRDPNAPKRPASAYILYQNEVRAKFREERPELSYRELLPEIAKAWQNLDPSEKQRYQDIVDKGKAVYTVQKKAYDMAHGGSNAASPTTTTASIVPPPTTTLRVPSTSAHHPSLMAPLNGGGMTPSSSHSHQSSEEEESEEEESEDDQTAHGHAHAHGHGRGAGAPVPVVGRHYHQHQQQEEDDEEEDEEEEEEPPMKKYKTQQLTMPPIATV